MESDPVRHTSQDVFQKVKAVCVQVSQLAQLPTMDNESLVYNLRQLYTILDGHRREHSGKIGQISGENDQNHQKSSEYVISPKLADYIFYPISCTLKHQTLPDSAVMYILHILAYLNETSWIFSVDDTSLDQMLPLVIFLARYKNEADSDEKNRNDFDLAAAESLLAVLKTVPTTYFKAGVSPKRFSTLGDSTNTLLSYLDTLGPLNEDIALRILSTLSWLYCSRVSADHTSLVFPGIVSKVINFHSTTKNLHTDTLVQIVELLGALAVKVFDQKDLDVQVLDKKVSLETVKEQEVSKPAENGQLVQLNVSKTHHNRTSSWLRATAQQFRLSVLIFMKNLILKPNGMNKIRTNPKLGDAIVKFASDIHTHCFRPLFNDLVMANLDILAALSYVQSKDSSQEEVFLEKVCSIYLMAPRSDLRLFHEYLLFKTENLASVEVPKALSTLNEEKIAVCLASVRLHLRILSSISDALVIPNSVENVVKSVIENVSFFLGQNLGVKKEKRPANISGFLGANASEENSLDGIELPPHIDARKLGTIAPKNQTLVPVSGSAALSQIDVDLESRDGKPRLFGAFLSSESEDCIQTSLAFMGQYVSDLEQTSLMLLENARDIPHVVALWVTNQMMRTSRPTNAFDLDEFLDSSLYAGDDDFGAEQPDELSYILLSHAHEILSQTQTQASSQVSSVSSVSSQYEVLETSYVIALETLSLVARRLSKDDFQADVLMDHLFPLLEALTFSPSSIVHQQARHSLHQIVDTHYGSSLRQLVEENSDYLVDSMSSQLSVSSGLTPSLPGILLVVLKISGPELLMSNQLHDVLSQMFIVIDSYHGYSVLVENFFYVFEEIVEKTAGLYAREISDTHKIGRSRPYKPWGLCSRSEMLEMIDDSNRKVDPFDYEPGKEYFKNPGIPFGEIQDSDDEDEGDEEEKGDENDKEGEEWLCSVPQNIYSLIQQIFTYGLQLLSHPSVKLRVQVLKTLKKAYGLMCTNYAVLMPLLAQYWPLVLVLATGAKSTSEYDKSVDMALMEPALELMIVVFEEDARHENFLASRFSDMWMFMERTWEGKSQLKSPVLKKLVCRLLVQGITNYGRQIADLTCHNMMRFCFSLGVSNDYPVDKTVQNHLYVFKQARHGGRMSISTV